MLFLTLLYLQKQKRVTETENIVDCKTGANGKGHKNFVKFYSRHTIEARNKN